MRLGASQTIGAIRDYPGLEKIRGLNILAQCHEKAGDSATAKDLFRQALEIAEAEAPANAPAIAGEVKRAPIAATAERLSILSHEIDPKRIERQKQMQSRSLRERLVDTEEAIRLARAMPAEMRPSPWGTWPALSLAKAMWLGALELAKSLETPEERLMALDRTACASEIVKFASNCDFRCRSSPGIIGIADWHQSNLNILVTPESGPAS